MENNKIINNKCIRKSMINTTIAAHFMRSDQIKNKYKKFL